MQLDQVGIALACRCGANMSANIAEILFNDKGRVKISGKRIQCANCGAIYRNGERLKYKLLFSNGSAGKELKILGQEIKTYYAHENQASKNKKPRYKLAFNGKAAH
jgi:hypothetical protein